MAEYRLEMRDVCKSFPGVKALDHAQLKLKPGTLSWERTAQESPH